MSSVQGSAPSPAGGSAETGTDTPTAVADYADLLRADTNRRVDAGQMTTIDADLHYKMADFCQQKNCYIAHDTRDWFGFGQIHVIFDNADDSGYWISLADAHHVSGMQWPDIREMFFDDQADDYDDTAELQWLVGDGEESRILPIVAHSFMMRAMLRGPWAREFMDNTMGIFRRAIVKTGLADKIGPVVVVKDGQAVTTDMTFGEFMAQGEPLPTEEEAREQGMRGPLGGAL